MVKFTVIMVAIHEKPAVIKPDAPRRGALSPQDVYEQGLMERAKVDPEVFGEFYEIYSGRVFGYFLTRTGNSIEAEDLTGTTFFNAFKALPSYKNMSETPPRAWLFRIAGNLTKNWYRNNSRHPRKYLSELPTVTTDWSSQNNPVEFQERNEEVAELVSAVKKLKPEQREVIIFRYGFDMSNGETGQRTGRTEGAVKAMHHRAVVNLRKNLQKD